MRRVALLLLMLAGATVATAAGDPAVVALRDRDAYVSPRADLPADAEARLAAAITALGPDRGPMKLVVTHGPVGSPSMPAYARRLRRELRFPGTVVVAAPGRPTAVVGPRDASETTAALRAARVGRIRDPVARAIGAARAAVPERDMGREWRGTLTLVGLGLVGGLWAVAIGMRRVRRDERNALFRSREILTDALVELDRRIDATSPGPDRDRAAGVHAEVREGVRHARSAAELAPLATAARDALATLDMGEPGDLGARLAEVAGAG